MQNSAFLEPFLHRTARPRRPTRDKWEGHQQGRSSDIAVLVTYSFPAGKLLSLLYTSYFRHTCPSLCKRWRSVSEQTRARPRAEPRHHYPGAAPTQHATAVAPSLASLSVPLKRYLICFILPQKFMPSLIDWCNYSLFEPFNKLWIVIAAVDRKLYSEDRLVD